MNESFQNFKVRNHHHLVANRFEKYSTEKSLDDDDRKIVSALWDATVILAQNELPWLDEIWNDTYPDAPMPDIVVAGIAFLGVDLSQDFNAHEIKAIQKVLQNLTEIGLDGLAANIQYHLSSRGYSF